MESLGTFTLLYEGVVVGAVRLLVSDGVAGGELHPIDAFAPLHAPLADASRALANHGFLPPSGQVAGGVNPAGVAAAAAPFARAQAICDGLELRDAQGRTAAVQWINVFGGRTPEEPITVMTVFDDASAGVAASVTVGPHTAHGKAAPAG